jgi:hypothetical protein
MDDDCNVPFLTVEEAATVLRVAKRTLDSHRSHKTGPVFRRHGGRIVYRLSDLLAWSDQRAVWTTGPRRKSISSPKDAECNGDRTSRAGLPEGEFPNASLERQPKHPDRPLLGSVKETDKWEAGSHPSP